MATPRASLKKFIRDQRLTYRQAADALGVTPVAVNDWIHGKRTPSPPMRTAIETWSGGVIAATAWASAAERRALARVVPHTARPAAA